ncbi:MAG: hypothetical protein OEN49_08425, partial [Gammaproteobacteria bacterium]|nr:hypothetical protein [Gammaproteobacteria bacterium]
MGAMGTGARGAESGGIIRSGRQSTNRIWAHRPFASQRTGGITIKEPVIIPRAQHTVTRAQISENALKVLNRLKDAGFASLLVGGCVRDL